MPIVSRLTLDARPDDRRCDAVGWAVSLYPLVSLVSAVKGGAGDPLVCRPAGGEAGSCANFLDCAAEATPSVTQAETKKDSGPPWCRLQKSSRDDEPARFREGPKAGAPGQIKSLGTDAFTASSLKEATAGDCRSDSESLAYQSIPGGGKEARAGRRETMNEQ